MSTCKFEDKSSGGGTTFLSVRGTSCEQYLNDVLDALASVLPPRPKSQAPNQEDTESASVDINNLYIGCHSGGGTAMKSIVKGDSLGSYKSKLKQCWGFDCVY